MGKLDAMAPEIVCLVTQTLYKGTLNEACIIRQIVDAVVVSNNLLPPVKTQRIAAKLSQNNEGCSVTTNTEYMSQNCLCSCSADLPTSLSTAQTSLA